MARRPVQLLLACQRARGSQERLLRQPCGRAHLGRVVDDDGVREVTPQDGQVLQVVALHEHAAVPEHAVPDHRPVTIKTKETTCSGGVANTMTQCADNLVHDLQSECNKPPGPPAAGSSRMTSPLPCVGHYILEHSQC